MKIAFINGVNQYENQAFLEALTEAYAEMQRSSDVLQIQTVDSNLLELHQLLWNPDSDYDAVATAIADRLRGIIKELEAQGNIQAIVVPLSAQLQFPSDYILDGVECRVFYTAYSNIRQKILRLAKNPGISSLFNQTIPARLNKLLSTGVMGLSQPAEAFSATDYLEEHTKGTSYSLVTPHDRDEVWKHLDDVFYGKVSLDGAFYGKTSVTDKEIRNYCLDAIAGMDFFCQARCDKRGLQGLFVTDFWTEAHLVNSLDQPDQMSNTTRLPNGKILPVLNLERVEAWSIIDTLLQ